MDGDETLWGGIAGEVGPEAVDLTGPRARLARTLLRWRAAGTLLALVSNNDEDTVRTVLDRPDSLLKAEHFSVLSADWGPKPDRLTEAARTLDLGLDSFLFLDDNTGVSYGVSNDRYSFLDGDVRDMKSRWSAVVQKDGGAWKLVSVHFSTNLLANPVLDAAKSSVRNAAIIAGAIMLVVGVVAGFLLGRRKA